MITGGCLCGAIRFEIDGRVSDFWICHCSKCRVSSGGPFTASALCRAEAFRFVRGEDSIRVHRTSSGYTLRFCETCGSPAPLKMEDRAVVSVGTLDDAYRGSLNHQIFVASKASWWNVRRNVTCYDEHIVVDPEGGPEREALPRSGPGDWSGEVAPLLGSDPPPSLEILYAIGHHPNLLPSFLQWSAALALRGVLERRDAELLALRTAWNCRSEFEWGHHVHYAREAGMSEEEIARIPAGPEDGGWSEQDRLLLEAADELHAGSRIADRTWRELGRRHSPAALIEIAFVVGQYTMLSGLANSAGVALEPGFDRLPE